jgi:hypothetical protein
LGSKPTPKLFTITAVILTILSAFALAHSSVSLQQTTAASAKTQELFLLLQESNSTVTEIFSQLQSEDKNITQASLDEYDEALVLAEESKSLLQAGDYSEANSKIIQALQKFKEALRIVYTTVPVQPTETEIALETAIQLRSSITRYVEQLERIENLTYLATAVGYNTTMLQNQIQVIKSLLDRASSNLDQRHFETASTNLAEAKTLGEQLLKTLTNIAYDLKTQRIANYINQTETRLAGIREKAELLSNTVSLAALDNAETSLDNAKEYLESQRISDSLSELANSKASEEIAVEYLQPTASSLDSISTGTLNAVQLP